jgi:hypothetical protein
MHKLYNFLECIFEKKLFTKVIKMPSWKARVERSESLKRGGRSAIAGSKGAELLDLK